MKTSTPARTWPRDFVWGVSTSAFQVEGAAREDGRGPSIWDTRCTLPGKVYKGGSGDVLAGMFAALLCQMPARDAVQTAVWLHGRAGDLCAGRMGEYAMNPTDVIAALPEVTKPIIR